MGNLFTFQQAFEIANKDTTTKKKREDKATRGVKRSQKDTNDLAKKPKHNNTNCFTFKIENLFTLQAFASSMDESSFSVWWKEIGINIRKEFRTKVNTIRSHDETCCQLVELALKNNHLEKNSNNPIVCPISYFSKPEIVKGDSIFSFEKGDTIPAKKYDSACSFFEKGNDSKGVLLFESVSGMGKTHFSNVLTQTKNTFCFFIHPSTPSFFSWKELLENGVNHHEYNKRQLDKICNNFSIAHIIALAMILQADMKVTPRDFLLFQKNGGNGYIKTIFQFLCSVEGSIVVDLTAVKIAWCIDEAHLFSGVLKGCVSTSTNSSNAKGSGLTVLTSSCRQFGSVFLTTTLTGLLEDIKSDISGRYNAPVGEVTMSLPILWPSEVEQFLNQMMQLPSTEKHIVSSFVCHQLMGPTRQSVHFFNILVWEASRNRIKNTNALLLKSLNIFLTNNNPSNTIHLSLANRYTSLKNEKYWDDVFDELIIYGRVDVGTQLTSLFKPLIAHGVCFDFHKKTDQIFLTSFLDKKQLIQFLSPWLSTLWNTIKKHKKINGGKLAELLFTYLLVNKFEECVAPILKDNSTFKHYQLLSKCWFHDIPFSAALNGTACHRMSSFLLKLIGGNFQMRTRQMKEWSVSNEKWLTDLPKESFTIYPTHSNSFLDFLIHPTEDAGPDVLGVLVRSDLALFLQGKPTTWIEIDDDLPPYIPLVGSCTIMKEEKAQEQNMQKDIATTRLQNMYSLTTNKQAMKEKEFLGDTLKTISKHSLTIIFAPFAENALPNIEEKKGEGLTVMFSKHLGECFETFIGEPVVQEILQVLQNLP